MKRPEFKTALIGGVISSLMFAAPAPAIANDLAKGLVGAVILCGITNCANNNKRATTTRRSTPRGNPTVKADQQALNYFGYNVGGADGVTGAKTRNGISQYQGFMGYPVTGSLDDYQRANLQNAHNWAQSGRGAAYPGIAGPELLKAYASEMRGGNYCVESGRCPAPYAPNQNQPMPAGDQADVYTASTPTIPPLEVVTPATTPSLPSFGDVAAQTSSKSMTAHCQSVGFLTNANGGIISDPSQITNPGQALDEQFCGARNDAMLAADQKISGANIPDAQLAEACGQVVSLMQPQIDALDSQSPQQVTISASQKATTAGWTKDMLMQTGEICLGYGYRTDDAATVLAANMLLVGADSTPYSELFGHHKRLGLGTGMDTDVAAEWYGTAFNALDAGAAPVFQPAQSLQRVAVMRAALGGGTVAQGVGGAAAPALPAFNLGNN